MYIDTIEIKINLIERFTEDKICFRTLSGSYERLFTSKREKKSHFSNDSSRESFDFVSKNLLTGHISTKILQSNFNKRGISTK